jgi:hypothetical protein
MPLETGSKPGRFLVLTKPGRNRVETGSKPETGSVLSIDKSPAEGALKENSFLNPRPPAHESFSPSAVELFLLKHHRSKNRLTSVHSDTIIHKDSIFAVGSLTFYKAGWEPPHPGPLPRTRRRGARRAGQVSLSSFCPHNFPRAWPGMIF